MSLEVAKIPYVSFTILALNLMTKLIDYGVESWLFWLYVVVNLLFYLVPMVNLYLFVKFMRGYPTSIEYFTWLIKKKRESVLLASAYV